MKLDHHCGVIGCDIGAKNYKLFVLMLLYTAICNCIQVTTITMHYSEEASKIFVALFNLEFKMAYLSFLVMFFVVPSSFGFTAVASG